METMNDEMVARMYIEDGLSVDQISKRLGVSFWKVRYILKKKKVVKRSISEAITNLNITKFGKQPFCLRRELSRWDSNLKLAGIMLYWGEGSKTGNEVGFSNSNPEMIKLFLLFLRRICGVEEKRIRPMIHMYPDQNKDYLEGFWSAVTKIDKKMFYRTYIHDGKPGTYKNKSKYGTVGIKYSDKKLLKLILGWIDKYKNSFLKIVPE